MQSTQTTEAGEAAEPPEDPECSAAPALPAAGKASHETPAQRSAAERQSSRRSALLEAIYYSIHSR